MTVSVFRKKILAGVLAAASLAAGFGAVAGMKTAQKQTFTGGSRSAVVTTADYKIAKSCAYVLYEDGQERVAEHHLRFFRDNAADVAEAKSTANSWVSAPEEPRRYDYPGIPF